MTSYDILVRSRLGDYHAEIAGGFGFLAQLAALPNRAVLVDRRVASLYKERLGGFGEGAFLFDALESNKTLEQCELVYDWLTEHFNAKRNLNFISIGGGITQDVSGFVASTLYRGINWYFVPTTLLSQVDSCIGGKTSLNFRVHKNLIGTFFPPKRIFISPDFVGTLAPIDRASGCGEIIKFLLMDAHEHGGLETVKARVDAVRSGTSALPEAIRDCLNIKRAFMEADEFDRGRRNLLNYGHCFGHALEASSGYYVPHGIAVDIGIVFADIVAAARGTMPRDIAASVARDVCLPNLIQPQRLDDYDADRLLANLRNDKKRVGNGLPLVMPAITGGKNGLVKIDDLTENEFRDALAELKSVLFGSRH